MDRIIIKDVDNTSNVETLSSYDVAYVPGFSNGPNNVINQDYYRTPILVTDKYDFVKKFGASAPRFTSQQAYPSKFENVAIKWSDNDGAYIFIQTNDFATIADVVDSGFYTQLTEQITEVANATQYYKGVFVEPTDTTNGYYHLTRITTDVVATVNNLIGGFVSNTDETPQVGKTYYTFDDSTDVYSTWVPNWPSEKTSVDYVVSVEETYVQPTEANPVIGTSYYEVTEFTGDTFVAATDYYTRERTFDTDPYVYTKTEDETPQPGKTYFTIASSAWTKSAFDTTYSSYFVKVSSSSLPIFSSTTNPATNGWYELTGQSTYEATTDTYIVDADIYYSHQEGVPAMFEVGDADPGYRYAYMLLSMGMPVYYEQMNADTDDITVASMYDGLVKRFVGTHEALTDPDYSFDSMGDYSVKFITSGGYPTFEYDGNSLANNMIALAAERQDAIALIDHTDNPTRSLDVNSEDSVITSVRNWSDIPNDIYGAMFTPWFDCSNSIATTDLSTLEDIKNTTMPGSLAYLTSLSQQVQNYNPWLAVSGVTRGKVPYCSKLHTNKPLTNNIADTFQLLPSDITGAGDLNISINPITWIRNYGYCIWGNRTLRNNESGTKASSFLNIRSAVSDIKKVLYEASQQLLFEQNTDVLWINFKSLVTPILETMKSDYILNDYAISRLATDPETGAPVPAYKVLAVIRIQPINSVEVFDLTVYLENVQGATLITSAETEE